MTRGNLQLVGVAALWVASKHEEEWQREVSLPKLVAVAGNAYSKQDIQDAESRLLTELGFRVAVPTAYTFLTRLLAAARVEEGSLLAHLATFIAEVAAVRYRLLRHLPSAVAAAALNVALRTMVGPGAWTPALEAASGFGQAALRPVILDLQAAMAAAGVPAAGGGGGGGAAGGPAAAGDGGAGGADVDGAAAAAAAVAASMRPTGILRKYSQESRGAVALRPIAQLP